MTEADKAWGELVAHLNQSYYKPDIGALEVTLSVATAHYFRQDEPVWLMIVGPPGTGKTSVCIGSVLAMPYTYNVDTLTPNTLLSGFARPGGGSNSLLHNIGTEEDHSGIITMADFSAFLGLREETRREIAGQLRKVYDGYLDRPTGVGWLEWEGKVTLIAAATSAAERTWSSMKELGERFMCVRWPRGDGIEQARFAFRQIGKEEAIKEKTQALVATLVGPEPVRPILEDTTPIEEGVAYLAEVVARARAKVERERTFRRDIVEEPEPEGPTRIMKAMAQAVVGHAALFQRKEVRSEDFMVAKRIGVDSIPPLRLAIIRHFRNVGSQANRGCVGVASVVRGIGVSPTTIGYALDELAALGILEHRDFDAIEKSYRMSDEFWELLDKADPILKLI